MSEKVFFIVDSNMGSVVDADHAEEHKIKLQNNIFYRNCFEIVSKEEFIARGFHYYEDNQKFNCNNDNYEEESFDYDFGEEE